MTFQDVETARERYHQKTKKYWKIIGIILLVVLIIAVVAQILSPSRQFLPFLLFPAFFVLVIGAIIISFATSKDALAYRRAYKAYFVEQNLKTTFTDLAYNHADGLSRELIRSTGMINTGDCYSSNDLTVARYKDVKFLQADSHIEVEHTDSDGDTYYSTIFKGRIMIYEFPKKFNFKLEIIGNRFAAYRLPPKNPTTGRKMSKISTESTEFNHSFRVYGEDGFEAFYILDPAFMVKIQTIAERYKYSILFGFLDNRLIIALNDGKDSFEPPRANKPIDEHAEMAKIQGDIKVITDFVDQLSLDRKLFK